MTPASDTEHLIQRLAGEAGKGPRAGTTARWLLPAALLSLAVAVALVFLWFGVSPQLLETLQGLPFQHKVASMLLLTGGGLVLARDAVRPGGRVRPFLALAPGAALLLIGAVTDRSGLPVLGQHDVSVPSCLAAIVLLSLPPLGIMVGVLRTGAPTRPSAAGAVAGLLAGTLGAAAYALACKNDGGLFVAIWYSTAILATTGLGAFVGRRALAW